MSSTKERYDFIEKDKFLSDVFEMALKKAVQAGRDRNSPVVRFKLPEELQESIDFNISKEAVDHSQLLDICSKVFDNSVLTGHPRFFHQLMGGLDTYGFAGEIIASSLTTDVMTYDISPVFNVAEFEVIKHARHFAGFNNGNGIFCPGGSYSNLVAMNLARFESFPQSKEVGLKDLPKLVTFCSEHAHYSAQQNSILLGFGKDNCVAVKCDVRGKMIPKELEDNIIAAKENGSVPVFVTATAGTTVLGAFDPISDIADICEKHNIWLHVDGAWGGSALLSQKYKHLCDGIERANSMAWNFHKMVCAPIQCSLLLVKEPDILRKAHLLITPYLHPEEKPYDITYDIGRNTIQCGRKADAFKLWLMWKAKGDKGMEEHVDHALGNAEYLTKLLKERIHFRLAIPEPEYTNIPFWFIPPSMRGEENNKEGFLQKLSMFVPIIKRRMQKCGSLLVGFSPTPELPTFFRMAITNKLVNHEDMEFVLDEIERHGQDL